MKNTSKFHGILCSLLFLSNGLLAYGGKSATHSPDSRAVSIRIEAAGWGAEEPHVYPQGKAIAFRCYIQNMTQKTIEVRLKDHDEYQGTLPYPIGFSARVLRDDKTLVTQNEIDISGQGWWSQYYLWSNSFKQDMPGDVISLPPKSTVVRLLSLDKILSMCPNIKDGLPQGAYTVAIKFNNVVSNEVKFQIAPPDPGQNQ